VDYEKLALELFNKMHSLRKAKPQKNIDGALQGEAFALHFIALQGGAVLPGAIKREMNVSSARVAQALNNLEEKGWITRKIDKSDRRKILIEITEEGRSAAEKNDKAIIGLTAKMLCMLGERDAKEYVRITGRLADIISNCNESYETDILPSKGQS